MGIADSCSTEQGYERVGKWNPRSAISNRRLYSHSPTGESLDADDEWDVINLAATQTNTRFNLDESEIASTRDGFKRAVMAGNDSLAIWYCTEYPHLNLHQTIFEESSYDSALHIAVEIDNHKLMLYLLTAGLSPNVQNGFAETPLHTACRHSNRGTIKVIAILLKYSADPLIQNCDGESALDVAQSREYPDEDIIDILCKEVQEELVNALSSQITQSTSLYSPHGRSVLIGSVGFSRAPSLEGHPSITSDVASFSPPPAYIPRSSSFVASLYADGARSSVEEMHSPPFSGNLLAMSPTMLRMTTEEVFKLEAQKVQSRNPFRRHRRRTTEVLNGMLAISEADHRVPGLEGWLEKRDKEGKWQKKYVVVRGAYLLWADKQMDITDVSDMVQRERFNGYYNLYCITKVEQLVRGSEHQRKWQFTVGDERDEHPIKVFVWRAQEEKDRDDWVQGLLNRMQLLDLYHGYLEE